MKRLKLTKQVTVTGKDFFGRKAKTTFYPSYKPGWHWLCGSSLFSINSKLVVGDMRRITLGRGDYRLEIYEHIGALRFTGLDYVVVQSTDWPPYFGRIYEFWEALRPHCAVTDSEIPWKGLDSTCQACSPKDSSRIVQLIPGGRGLEINVIVDMPGIGVRALRRELPADLDDFFKAYTLGWPSWTYYLSALSKKFLKWDHHERITWARENSKDDLLTKIVMHRAGDLLGALSLISHDKLVSGKVISQKGSHRIDMSAIKQIKAC